MHSPDLSLGVARFDSSKLAERSAVASPREEGSSAVRLVEGTSLDSVLTIPNQGRAGVGGGSKGLSLDDTEPHVQGSGSNASQGISLDEAYAKDSGSSNVIQGTNLDEAYAKDSSSNAKEGISLDEAVAKDHEASKANQGVEP